MRLKPYKPRHDKKGRFTSLITLTRNFALYGLILVVAVGLFASSYAGGGERSSARGSEGVSSVTHDQTPTEVSDDCVEVEDGKYVCAEHEALARWREYEGQVQTLGEQGIKRKQYKTILKEVCKTRNLQSPCEDHLLGMATVDSGLGKWMVGDSGFSKGWFHIHSKWHKVANSCLMDLKCSAEYTLDRMISLGYKKDPESAIRLHNGSLKNPKTLAYLDAVLKKMK
jgi:hypothetical protein